MRCGESHHFNFNLSSQLLDICTFVKFLEPRLADGYNFLVIRVEFSKYLWSLLLIFGFNCLNLVINSALLLVMFHSHCTCPSMSCNALCCQIPCLKSSPQGFYSQSQLTFNNPSISSIHDVGGIGYGFIAQMIRRKHCKIFDLPQN